MVHINLIITLFGSDFNDRVWSEVDCQMMTYLRRCANKYRCEGPYHIKYWVNLHVLKGYLYNEKFTLVFDSSFSVLQHLVSLCSPEGFDLNNYYIMGGNLNRNEPTSCESWKGERKIWRRLHKNGFTDYMEKLHGSKKFVSHGFAKGQKNNRVTLFGQT